MTRKWKQTGETPKTQALGRLPQGTMNGMEAAYSDVLYMRRHSGEVLWYDFEGMKFRLADKTFYTPDFIVMLANGEMEAHEVKGFWRDDARVKIKVAASMYPFRFVAVAKNRKIGGWEVEEF